MKKIKKHDNFTNLLYDNNAAAVYLPNGILTEGRCLFFDIETTGFSAEKSRLYLIGAAYIEHGRLVTEQFFAESYEEEAQLLHAFDELVKRFDTAAAFNGQGFDLPYLAGCRKRILRAQACNGQNAGPSLPCAGGPVLGAQKPCLDLYRDFSAYRHVFQLQDCKQKTLESFLGIRRTGRFDGGELISVYQDYLRNPGEEKLELLLQHNREDLLGMVRLMRLYAFDDFFGGNFRITDSCVSAYRTIDGAGGLELAISCMPAYPLPAAVSCAGGSYFLHADKERAVFHIPVLEGTLKYFYPDHKDYYYLPDEDTAIHKSAAVFVDRAHRRKARARECYTKKTGRFLPQQEEMIKPAFYKEYKDSCSYFELPEPFSDQTVLKKYCMHMLQQLRSLS